MLEMKTIYSYKPVDLCVGDDFRAPGVVCARNGKAIKGEPKTVYCVMSYKTEKDAENAFFGESKLSENRIGINV